MKTSLIAFIAIFLFVSPILAINSVDFRWQNSPDTLVIGNPAVLDIWIENDIRLYGLSLGLIFWSPDGVSWQWDAQLGGWGYGGEGEGLACVTVVPGNRLDPVEAVLDMTELLITEHDMDGAGADSVLIGGVAMNGGIPEGELQPMLSLHLTPTGITTEDIGILCVDSIFIPPSGAFVFTDETGMAFSPTRLWTEGGLCIPVTYSHCNPPELTDFTSAASTGHCDPITVENAAVWTDGEGDPITISLKDIIGGIGVATITDNGDGTCDVSYTPAPADACGQVQIIVQALDDPSCDNTPNDYTLTIDITNETPLVEYGNTYNPVCAGSYFSKMIYATDPDVCDDITFGMISGPGGIDPVTGEYLWLTSPADIGVHGVTISVSDGVMILEINFDIDVIACEWYMVAIGKLHDVHQGHFVDLPIYLRRGVFPMAGFDFLLAYDNSLLTFTEATIGAYFADCGWEYFSYRHGSHGNCGSGCPSGEIRLVGLAETDNGPYHPDLECINEASVFDEVIANLRFFVTTDFNANDQFAQVKFFWMDCGDNSISVPSGDTLGISRFVYDYDGINGLDSYVDVTDRTWGFPGVYGASNDCVYYDLPSGKVPTIRFVDFKNGGIDIIDKDLIDDRGDINLNGIPNEIADAVIFTNYFIVGHSAFGEHVDGSTAASDINADGTALTIADLVYLIRIIIGDALPYPKPATDAVFGVETRQTGDEFVIEMTPSTPAGAALFVLHVDGEAGEPIVHNNMDVISNYDNGELRVLVYNIGREVISSGDLLIIPINGSAELVSVDAADYNGAMMEGAIRNLPSSFRVHQNYPNPFNPETTISFDLSVATDWHIEIYNVAGQKVNGFAGFAEAGAQNVMWDGTDTNGSSVASGIYFYRVTAGANSATMKMVLMK